MQRHLVSARYVQVPHGGGTFVSGRAHVSCTRTGYSLQRPWGLRVLGSISRWPVGLYRTCPWLVEPSMFFAQNDGWVQAPQAPAEVFHAFVHIGGNCQSYEGLLREQHLQYQINESYETLQRVEALQKEALPPQTAAQRDSSHLLEER